MSELSTPSLSLEDAASRSGVYRLLARLWLYEVDDEILHQLRCPPLGDAWAEVGGSLPTGESQSIIDELALSYCQLFLGPKNHLPPFQSVWQKGQFQGTSIESMNRAIDVVGYDVSSLPTGIMLDHLGIQLDIMGHVLSEISSWPADSDGVDRAWELANSFFAAHLQWAEDLFKTAEQRADHEFYRSCVKLTREFLKSETVG